MSVVAVSEQSHPTITVVSGGSQAAGLLSAFEHALPVKFVRRFGQPASEGELLELSYASRKAKTGAVTHVFMLDVDSAPLESPAKYSNVTFADHPLLDSALRGRTVPHPAPPTVRPVTTIGGDLLLANYDGVPVWVKRIRGGYIFDIVSISLPSPAANESAYDYLHGGNFIQLLPLYHFLKGALIDAGWRFPHPRACLMFDDPNLHWNSYGFISYPELVRRGHESNYHVAFATVPFDGWYVNESAASLFRNNPDRVSLLMHGNNHIHAELARQRSPAGHLALMAQGMRRIERLEQRSRVHVCRTMAPPHGACSNANMEAMLAVGVEAAFISPWSLRLWDDSRSWPTEFGVSLAESVGKGFAVLPRFKLTESCEGSVIISALLGRAIVPVGHHHDLKGGPELLDTVAAIINRLPDVVWCNTETLARSNFLTRKSSERKSLHVLPFSTQMDVAIPDGVESVVIAESLGSEKDQAARPWMKQDARGQWMTFEGTSIPDATAGTTLSLKLAAAGCIPPASVPTPSVQLAAPMRRILCEVRDRVQPLRSLTSRKIRVYC